eukprot:13294592-Ditylum_brightwellii.AAC.1
MLEVFISSINTTTGDIIKEQMIQNINGDGIHTSCSESIMGIHPTQDMGDLAVFYWRDRKNMSCCWEENENQDLECTPPGPTSGPTASPTS